MFRARGRVFRTRTSRSARRSCCRGRAGSAQAGSKQASICSWRGSARTRRWLVSHRSIGWPRRPVLAATQHMTQLETHNTCVCGRVGPSRAAFIHAADASRAATTSSQHCHQARPVEAREAAEESVGGGRRPRLTIAGWRGPSGPNGWIDRVRCDKGVLVNDLPPETVRRLVIAHDVRLSG